MFVYKCKILTYLIGHNDTINGFRPAVTHSRSIAVKAAVTSRLVRPMMPISSTYASNWTLFRKIAPFAEHSMAKLKRSYLDGAVGTD